MHVTFNTPLYYICTHFIPYLFLQTMDALVEPPACVGAFTTTANRLHCIWRGAGPAKGTTKIKIFNPTNDEWTLQPTTGTPPRGLWNGGCAFIGKDLYSFGGNDGSFSHFNYLHKLSLETFQWSEIHPRNDQTNWPMPKSGCGFTAADERTLCCFGGVTNIGRTNEFHLFDVQEGTIIILGRSMQSMFEGDRSG